MAYTYRTVVTYTNRTCLLKERVTADSLLGKAVLCAVSVVKPDCVQSGAATNRVRREISISVAALDDLLR